MSNAAGNLPTTDIFPAGDVAMSVIKRSRHNPDSGVANTRATPWQQYRREDLPQRRVVFGFVIMLCSRSTKEIWLCDMTSCPDEVIVNNGEYRMILHIYPRRGIVIGNSSVDCMGNQLPSHACLFTLLVPVNVPMIYNATLQLVKELEDHSVVVCDEILFSIKTNLLGTGFSQYYQNGNVVEEELYPLPKIKLTGVMRNRFTWSTIMHFEHLADNGQFSLYRRHRKLLERWAKTRPQYQDLVAMILLEEGVASIIQTRLEEGVNLAKRACRLSSYYNCVNDRAIRGYASAVYAAADRFAGDQDGAKEHIIEALEIFEPMEPSTYTSITLYNIGAITMEKSASVGVSEVEIREAEIFLEKAAQHWNHQQLNTSTRVLPRIYNRLISLYLKSSPNCAPDLNLAVSQENLTRAGTIITRYHSLFSRCSNWVNSTFYLSKADYCIRLRDIDGGLTAAQKARDVSMQSGLVRETTGATQRITLLRQLDDLRRRPPELPESL